MSVAAVKCPVCAQRTLVLWTDGHKACCDACLADEHGLPAAVRLVFSPQQLDDGSWISGENVEFAEMRAFVDECMRPSTATRYKGFLTSSPGVVLALISLMELMIVAPPNREEFLRTRHDLGSLQEQIDSLTQEEAEVRERVYELAGDRWRAPPVAGTRFVGRENQPPIDVQATTIPETHYKRPITEGMEALHTRQRELREKLNEVTTQVDSAREALQAFFPEGVSHERERIVQRQLREYRAWVRGTLAVDFDIPVHRVHWHILKPSGDSWRELLRYYETLSRNSGRRYDLERLRQIHDLKPDQIFVGRASFEGYVVFVFTKEGTAVLDCPEVGNAVYVMESRKWKFLSQLSKTELLRYHRDEVRRIVHYAWYLSHLNYYLTHPPVQ